MATINQSGQDGGDDGTHLLSAQDGSHYGTPHLAAQDGGHVGTPHLSAQDGGQVIAPSISQCAIQGGIDISITSQPTVNTTSNTSPSGLNGPTIYNNNSQIQSWCHTCQQLVYTMVEYRTGSFAVVVCLGLFLLCESSGDPTTTDNPIDEDDVDISDNEEDEEGEEDDEDEDRDHDDHLIYLEEVLRRIHGEYYSRYDAYLGHNGAGATDNSRQLTLTQCYVNQAL
ncbi:uncharacterized protein LOC134458504 [Engraulis encrasicolus]|uniref:uncharacterized protein LOC134458504 n=1 Tax=Engraulis encrasicolus TaxID=184585 RepID=UPI002FD095CC